MPGGFPDTGCRGAAPWSSIQRHACRCRACWGGPAARVAGETRPRFRSQVGAELNPSFPDAFDYSKVPIQDVPEQDLISCLHDPLEYIGIARQTGGRPEGAQDCRAGVHGAVALLGGRRGSKWLWLWCSGAHVRHQRLRCLLHGTHAPTTTTTTAARAPVTH